MEALGFLMMSHSAPVEKTSGTGKIKWKAMELKQSMSLILAGALLPHEVAGKNKSPP